MTNPMQPYDPAAAPPAITPQGGPSDPAAFAAVTPHGQGPAPYDIQANLAAGQAEIAGAFDATNREMGAGVLFAQGPRQAQTEVLLNSAQGFSAGGGTSGYDITAGTTAGWPSDVEPDILETPIQGQPTYPSSSTR